jgi:hypothetical protein
MSARSEVESLIAAADAELRSNPIQQMSALSGDAETYNTNQVFARLNAVNAALLLLADKIDAR